MTDHATLEALLARVLEGEGPDREDWGGSPCITHKRGWLEREDDEQPHKATMRMA
jgi:hypothetical protein